MKKHTNNILIILLLTLMVIGCFQDKGAIIGTVTDYDNKAVSGAEVVAEPHGFTTTTDENGDYIINNVPLGDYTLTVSSGDFGGWAQASVKGESFLGCEDISMSPEIRVEANIQFSLNSFPLKIGNYWEYKIESGYGITISTSTTSMSVTGTQNISGTNCFIIQYEDIPESQYTSTEYWAHVNNELRCYGFEYTFSGTSLSADFSAQNEVKYVSRDGIFYNSTDNFYLPKKGITRGTSYNSSNFNIQDMEIYVPPHILLVFPLFVGNMWYYTRDYFTIIRKVVGKETITVPAGTFDCIKVQEIYSDVSEYEIYLWYSPIGLIKHAYNIAELEFYMNKELKSYTLN